MKKLIYPERNRLLLKLSIPMFVSIIVIARYSTYPALPGFRFLIGPTPDDSIPYDIAIGYFSCYVFYLIQVYFPQRNREIKALKSLELYLKSYLRNARMFYEVLQDYDFTQLPECEDELPLYQYRNSDGEIFVEDFKIKGKKVLESDFVVDGIYDFLLKANNIYEQMTSNQAFSSVDAFLINQIQKINMPYWFETYENILILRQNGHRDEIQPFRSDNQQRELIKSLGMAIDQIEVYLGIQSMTSRLEG